MAHFRLPKNRPARILVIRLGALGDVVRTLPAVAGLRARFPDAQLTWLVEPKAAGVVRNRKEIDRVWVFPRDELTARLRSAHLVALVREMLGIRRRLREARFDLVLDFQGIAKSGVLAWLSGAPIRMGYTMEAAREFAWLFANRRIALGKVPLSRYERNAALVLPLGVDPDVLSHYRLECDRAALARVDAQLSGRPQPVVLHPGSSRAASYKRLPGETYAGVAQALEARAGLHSIVTYGPGRHEREEALSIVEASSGAASLAPETTTFADLAAVLARARVVIGGDTGPLHVASLLGTPVVQLVGPTHPVENAPLAGTPARSLRIGLACSPCRRGCAEAPCMSGMRSEAIALAALDLLALPDRISLEPAPFRTAAAPRAASV